MVVGRPVARLFDSLQVAVPTCAAPDQQVRIAGHGCARLQVVPRISALDRSPSLGQGMAVNGDGFACSATEVFFGATKVEAAQVLSVSRTVILLGTRPAAGEQVTVRTAGGTSNAVSESAWPPLTAVLDRRITPSVRVQRVGDAADERLLARRYAKNLDFLSVRSADCSERHHCQDVIWQPCLPQWVEPLNRRGRAGLCPVRLVDTRRYGRSDLSRHGTRGSAGRTRIREWAELVSAQTSRRCQPSR
jgi:hypothetical protein